MPAELAVSQEAVVVGGGEKCSVEVTREGTLSQCQLLHLSSCFLVSLLHGGGWGEQENTVMNLSISIPLEMWPSL